MTLPAVPAMLASSTLMACIVQAMHTRLIVCITFHVP